MATEGDYTESEFMDLSNRSEAAFWFMVNGPLHWSQPGWSAARVATNMKRYQKALTRYAKRRRGMDTVQLRALEHIGAVDRTLGRVFAATVCRRDYRRVGGKKWWLCAVHGVQRGGEKPCTAAYMSWLGRVSF